MIASLRRSPETMIVYGILAVLFGLIAAFWPVGTALTLVTLWGIYALVDGISAFIQAFRNVTASSRWWFVFTGIVGVLAGILAITRPFASSVALAWVLGIWLMVRGIAEFIGGFAPDLGNSRWLLLLAGVGWFVAGILFVAYPGAAALSIALWLGILAIVWGLLAIGAGFSLRSDLKQIEADSPAGQRPPA